MAEYSAQIDDWQKIIDEKQLDLLNIVSTGADRYHLLYNSKSYMAEIIEADYTSKKFHISIEGTAYTINLKDHYDQMIETMGLMEGTANKIKELRAPMPGIILDILINKGDKISEGTPLMVLSAMKMENKLVAPNDGIVKSILVEESDTIEKDQLLVEFE